MADTPILTDDDIYNLAVDGYLYELGILVKIVNSGHFKEILPLFFDYEKFLSSGRDQIYGSRLMRELLEDGRVIYCQPQSKTAKNLFVLTNLAACCEVFKGWTIPVGELESSRIHEYMHLALANATESKAILGRKMSIRLNKADTARVIQTLKLLDLMAVDTSTCKQLSLGASVGERDRQALHQVPFIRKRLSTQAVPNPSMTSPLAFGVESVGPENIVLIDNDIILESVYKKLNSDDTGRVLALNLDVYEGLDKLSTYINNGQMQPRDLVVAFRIEPKAFPNIDDFLCLLGPVIAESADFVITIGAGDTVADFTHRISALNRIDECLIERGMTPVRMKCYKGETHEAQRAHPIFGLGQYASYETLFCKLNRDQLVNS